MAIDFSKEYKSKSNTNAQFALSTFDNPWSPFTHFDEWYAFDMNKARHEGGADTLSVLARVAMTSFEMSEEMYNAEVERAIDQIVKYDMTNTYVKLVNENYVNVE